MKSTQKLAILIFTILMFCVPLSGCTELDELRDTHAVFTTQNEFDSITFNDTEYKRIDLPTPPHPASTNLTEGKPIAVTQPDVPLLLSQAKGNTLYLSDDGNFIHGWLYKYDEFDNVRLLYCKADMYDEVSNKLQEELTYNKYAITYSTPSTDYQTERYILSQEEIDAVNNVITEIDPVKSEGQLINFNYIYNLEKVTDDSYFAKYGYHVCSDGKNYALLEVENALYSDDDTITTHIPVPEDMKEVFVNLEKMAYDGRCALDQFIEHKEQ